MASIEKRQRDDGAHSWRVVWRQDGRKRSETFASEGAAREFRGLVDAAGQSLPIGWVPGLGYPDDHASETMPLREWADRAIAARTGITTGTRSRYAAILTRHVYPELGDIPLGSVTRERVAVWMNGLTLSPKSIANVHGLLSSILSDAAEARLIPANPVARMRLPRHDTPDRREMTFLSRDEFAILLAAAPPEYRLLLRTLVTTGLRWGEVTALQVSHFDGARLDVRQAWKATTDGTLTLGPPKSAASRRVVPLTPDVADDLAVAVTGRLPSAWLFTSPRGHVLRNGTFHTRVWAPTIARAQRCEDHADAEAPCGCVGTLSKRPRIHDLRHTHVAWLMSEGMNVYRIQARLGHESYSTTIGTYGHLLEQDDSDLLAAIGSTRPQGAPTPLRRRQATARP